VNYNYKFEEAYKSLNERQKEAVDNIEGPVMVVAGPGTGKTQVLTLRIANILKNTDTEPDSILALTFTESATSNMRNRLASLIGPSAYYININTFHGFCGEIIQNFPEYFPHIIGSVNIDKIKQIEIIQNILNGFDYKYIRPLGNPYFYTKELIWQISNLKRDGIMPEAFKNVIEKEKDFFYKIEDLYNSSGSIKTKYQTLENKILRSFELLDVYQKYQKKLRENFYIDFDDMVLETISALQNNPDFLLLMQEKHQYILVDEYQDTNGAQNMIVELLGGFYETPNIFVVGDARQAIYKFQGASTENFLFFAGKYSNTKVISLKESYRSGQDILDASHSLIEKNSGVFDKLESQTEKKANLYSGYFKKREDEIFYIAQSIKKYIAEGVLPSEIAILYRENKEALDYFKIFETEGIKTTVQSDFNILESEIIKKIILLFESINNLNDMIKMIAVLHMDIFNIEPIDIYRLLKISREEKKNMIEIMDSKELMKKGRVKNIESIYNTGQKLQNLRKKSFNESFLLFFERILHESGLIADLLNKNTYHQDIKYIKTLMGVLKTQISINNDFRIKDFIEFINLLKEHGESLNSVSATDKNSVRLMTAHKAKGLEFEIVYITGFNNKKWGNKRKVDLFLSIKEKETISIKNEEERRLFYMALTRAKKDLYITGFTEEIDGRSVAPSQFIYEIDESFIKSIDTNISYNNIPKPKKSEIDYEEMRVYLRDIFVEQGLSATALNNYLKCPWQFFYLNLIRLPQAQNIQAGLGQAVHIALRYFFETSKIEKVDESFLITQFKNSLHKIYLSTKDLQRISLKGEEMLKKYYNNYKDSFNYHTLNEIKISGNFFKNEKIKITGVIDKIEFLPNSSEVLVIDYKTGKPRSRNEIEGNTKDSDGNYKRQLLFYSLLMNSKFKKYNASQFILDFIKPNDRGLFKREAFILVADEKNMIRELVQKVWQDIYDLAFWDERCSDKKCEWCELRNKMK